MSFASIIEDSLKDTQLSKGASPPGLQPLNWGISRLVFKIEVGDYAGKVLKVNRHQGNGQTQNVKEIQTWRSVVGTEAEKYFCPLVPEACDTESYEYIVMDMVAPGVKPSQKEEIRNQMNKLNVPARDLTQGNLGMHRRKGCVIIDYPYGKFSTN